MLRCPQSFTHNNNPGIHLISGALSSSLIHQFRIPPGSPRPVSSGCWSGRALRPSLVVARALRPSARHATFSRSSACPAAVAAAPESSSAPRARHLPQSANRNPRGNHHHCYCWQSMCLPPHSSWLSQDSKHSHRRPPLSRRSSRTVVARIDGGCCCCWCCCYAQRWRTVCCYYCAAVTGAECD